MSNPFRYFNSSPEVIRLVVMMYVRYPLSLRNVEDLLAERGTDQNDFVDAHLPFLNRTPGPPPFSSMDSTRGPFERNRGCSGCV
jgi:hypothetical protein